ncbi:MAG: Uma2 family endonuclease [Chitinophagaceae bacterium]
MSSAYKILPHYTYNDWVHWEGKWELIEGIPFAMRPSPVPKHQRVGAEIITEFIFEIRKFGCKKCRVYAPIDFKISDDTILEPDILIVCGEIKKKYLDFPPVLVVEILSIATMLKDRNTKFHLYEQQGVKFFLIVDTEKEVIEIYELVSGIYQLQTLNNEGLFKFELEEDCKIIPDLKNIWL